MRHFAELGNTDVLKGQVKGHGSWLEGFPLAIFGII